MRNGASWMAEGKKDSRGAVSFRREEKRERGRGTASEEGEERVPGLLEPEERIKEKREKCV